MFRRKRWVKVGPKALTLGPSPFHKCSYPSKNFQTVFLFARVQPLVRILAILDPNGGVRAQKPPKNGYFVNAELVRKTLEIFSVTSTNALRIRNSFFWLNSIASLVKLLYELDDIKGAVSMKNHPK